MSDIFIESFWTGLEYFAIAAGYMCSMALVVAALAAILLVVVLLGCMWEEFYERFERWYKTKR